jgi:DNA modification methylase
MEMLYINPTKVKIHDEAPRYREDLGDIKSLAESIKKTRQIMPIIITRDLFLIDGGRRLAACIMNKQEVKAVYEDVVDLAEMRELEIEANLYRKDFTPAEEAIAVRDLYELQLARKGPPLQHPGGTSAGHRVQDTADLIGKSKASVIESIQLAAMIDAFPQLRNVKKRSDIKKAAKSLQKLTDALRGMKAHADHAATNKDFYQIECCDAVEHMRTIPDASIDILLTDPIYGIDADKVCMTSTGKTGGELTTSGYKIEDKRITSLHYYRVLARESFRFCTGEAHAYVFVGPEHYHHISRIFTRAGWRVHVKPLIWIKRETGQCNVPSAWPSSCYEMFLYARRDNSKLVQEGMPDWIECPPVDPSKRLHPYEKPIPLLMNMIQRVATPGQRLYDPFAGSASTLEAAVKSKLFAIGCDIDQSAYAMALSRLSKIGV